jgi:hypothetical protein
MKSSQKKQFAILIKYMELQNTLHIFSQEEQVLSMCSLPEEENNPQSLLNSLRPFCTPKELETIDMLTNMFSGSHPQEIVNIIEEKPQPDAASAQDSIAQDTTAGDDPFRQGDDQFLADNTWNDDFDAGFGDDDFGSDDDSWV